MAAKLYIFVCLLYLSLVVVVCVLIHSKPLESLHGENCVPWEENNSTGLVVFLEC